MMMPQQQLLLRQQQCCSTSRFLPLRPAAAAPVLLPRRQHNKSSSRVQAWQQVIDQASGKPYYWNTDTNETAWELPTADTAPTAAPAAASQTEAEDSMSNDALFDVLAAAYSEDGSGMEFWEVARAHRKYGVFEPPFFDYLDQRQKAAANEAERDLAFKMMCRLSNPLLRQPAPFE